jgi:hypothetical protein
VSAALALLLLAGSGPAPFTLANGTAAPLEEVALRAVAATEWRPLAPGPLPAGARLALPSPGGEACLFDIRATSAGRSYQWRDVNLCDVKVVILNRRADGILWADYE